MLGYENKEVCPIQIAKAWSEKHIELLIESEGNSRFVYIKDFSRFNYNIITPQR